MYSVHKNKTQQEKKATLVQNQQQHQQHRRMMSVSFLSLTKFAKRRQKSSYLLPFPQKWCTMSNLFVCVAVYPISVSQCSWPELFFCFSAKNYQSAWVNKKSHSSDRRSSPFQCGYVSCFIRRQVKFNTWHSSYTLKWTIHFVYN